MRQRVFHGIALGIAAAMVASATAAEVLDAIVAEVGTEVIFLSEVEERAYALQLVRRPGGGTFVSDEDRRRALDELINEKILQLYATRNGLKVSDLEVEEATRRQLEQVRANFASEEEFEAALAAEGLTRETLLNDYRRSIRDKLLRDKVMFAEIYDKVDVSQREIRNYYEEHRDELERTPRVFELERVVLPIPPEDPSARVDLERVRTRIRGPEDFARAAKEVSEDEGSASRGGDLGWVRPGDLVEELAVVVDRLDAGQMSEVVRSRFGFHLIYVDEKDPTKGSRVFHILRRSPPRADERERLRDRLLRARESLLAGQLRWEDIVERFAPLADPNAWGAAGPVRKNEDELPPRIRDACAGVAPGGVSEVIEEPLALSLVRVRSVRGGDPLPLEKLATAIEERIRWEKVTRRFEEWIARQREETYVRIVVSFEEPS